MAISTDGERRYRFQQVAHTIRERILSGHYSEGERLPSQHRMAREFDVALNTFKAALDTLESEGYVARRVGEETFAAKPDKANTGANRVLAIDDEPHTGTHQGRPFSPRIPGGRGS
jgi:DNA-binding GntR family transcriptional regulator